MPFGLPILVNFNFGRNVPLFLNGPTYSRTVLEIEFTQTFPLESIAKYFGFCASERMNRYFGADFGVSGRANTSRAPYALEAVPAVRTHIHPSRSMCMSLALASPL